LAYGAGVVAVQEPSDDELPGSNGADLVADVFDDPHVLVADGSRLGDVGDAAVAPQVGPADAGGDGTDDGVGGFDDGWFGSVFDADIAGSVDDSGAHRGFSFGLAFRRAVLPGRGPKAARPEVVGDGRIPPVLWS
jgi:hypothetical protein